MRIAVPTDTLAHPILVHAHDVCSRLGWTLLNADVDACADMLLANKVEVALVSPIHYGLATGKLDLNIVDGSCVALQDYTNTMGVFFPNNVAEITRIGATNPTHFLSQMGAVVLRERFEAANVSVDLVATNLQDVDCVLAQPPYDNKVATLDVSEEFTDMAECPLPVYIWACCPEADIDALPSVLLAMADATYVEQQVEEEVHIHDEHFTREGKILYRWTDEVEEGLNAVFNLLFFHQILPKLPEINLLSQGQ